MAAFHAERDATATLALARPRIPWGAVETDAFGHITDFIESPPSPYLINAGVYVFSADVHRRCCRTAATTSGRRSRGWPASAGWPGFPLPQGAYWRAIDTAKDLTEAAKELAAPQAR